MCGIVGVIDLLRRRRLPAAASFDRMVDRLARRGPDGRGVSFADGGNVALGHRRLAIIDVSAASSQPFVKSGVALVFNGEIYNYRALRRTLAARGHHFVSDGDTEVLLEAWRAFGPRCVDHLEGIFAFVVVDGDVVFAARDHAGIKPLFVREHDGVIWFASELKAIIADDRVPRRLDPEGLDCFLTHGFIPAPLTAFAGIAQLPPATTKLWRFGETTSTTTTWWRPVASERMIGLNDAAVELEARLTSAVAAQLVSDVPLGAFLSGGLDSASIVAAMRDAGADVDAFSLGFTAAGFDETSDAKIAADAVGARHHVQRLSLDLQSTIADIATSNDDLLADASFIATDKLCETTREHVTVALSGDGADEILAGYPTYFAAGLARSWRHVPAPLRQLAFAGAQALPATTSRYSIRDFALRFLGGAERGPSRDFAGFRTLFDDDTRRRLQRRPADGGGIERYAAAVVDADAVTLLKRLLIADLTHFLPNDMLVKVDRASMRHGLEVRVPFLDRSFIQFALSLPSSLLLSPTGVTKRVLRTHVARRVSPQIAAGKKRGFSVPIGEAMRGALGETLRQKLTAPSFAIDGPIDVDVALGVLTEHREGRADHGHALYALLVLSDWWQQFIVG